MTIEAITLTIVGLASGLAVGTGLVAFLTVLGIIPRLTQLSKTGTMIHYYEGAVILGAISACIVGLNHISLPIFLPVVILVGLNCGVFVGMLAAALTEVLNVLPILSKRIGMEGKLIPLLMAIMLGKICGSLFQWLYFVIQ